MVHKNKHNGSEVVPWQQTIVCWNALFKQGVGWLLAMSFLLFTPGFLFLFFPPRISPLEKLFNLFSVPPLDLFPTSFSNSSFCSLPSLQPLYCALFSKYVTLSNHHHGQVADVRHTSMHGASWDVSTTFYEMLSNSLIKTNKKKLKTFGLQKWGLQICHSSVKLMSVRNVNTSMKRKCE